MVKEKVFICAYKDGLFDLVVYYSGQPDPYSLILKFQSIRSVVEGFYQVLVNHKELEPIESLLRMKKMGIWQKTEGLEFKERIKAAKAIYLMEKILEK